MILLLNSLRKRTPTMKLGLKVLGMMFASTYTKYSFNITDLGNIVVTLENGALPKNSRDGFELLSGGEMVPTVLFTFQLL
jgi:hypothetical protein